MRRVIALENPDGSLYRFPDGQLVTFPTVSAARPWLLAGQKLKPVDVPDDHSDALVAGTLSS